MVMAVKVPGRTSSLNTSVTSLALLGVMFVVFIVVVFLSAEREAATKRGSEEMENLAGNVVGSRREEVEARVRTPAVRDEIEDGEEEKKQGGEMLLQKAGVIHLRGLGMEKRERRFPVLIHVPKTGGTTIENAFKANYRFLVGRFAFVPAITEASERVDSDKGWEEGVYKTKSREKVNCAAWHRPPTDFVPESFAVIRHPYKRAVSEFCYRLSIKDQNPDSGFTRGIRESYERVYGAHKKDGGEEKDAHSTGDPRQTHCELFNDWILPILTKGVDTIEQNKLYDAKDCHFLSQWEYMKHAEWILEAETMSETIGDLMALYGYDDFDLSKTSVKTKFKSNISNSENSSPPECAPMTFTCFDDAIAQYLQYMDAAIFDIFQYERDWRRVLEEYTMSSSSSSS